MADNPIEVPAGLDAEAEAEFVRNAIKARGGDPDTVYLTSIESMKGKSQTLARRMFKIDWGI